MKLKYMQIVQEKYGFKDWDSILAALGHGGLKEGQIVNRLAEEYSKDHRKELTDESVLEKVAEAAKNKVHITRSKEWYRGQGNRRYGSAFFQMLQSGAGR